MKTRKGLMRGWEEDNLFGLHDVLDTVGSAAGRALWMGAAIAPIPLDSACDRSTADRGRR
jgi:hypothetical protein